MDCPVVVVAAVVVVVAVVVGALDGSCLRVVEWVSDSVEVLGPGGQRCCSVG